MRTEYSYGHQCIGDDDIAAVEAVLRSDCLTTGPEISRFEREFADYVGARHAVAVSNATAGLHLAALAAGLGPGLEGITSPMTFLSSANSILYTGAKVAFADIDPETANVTAQEIARHLTDRTRVIIPVHYAGQSCDMQPIHDLAKSHGLTVIEDAAHAVGSGYQGHKVGSCQYSDMAVFSFHPVKNMTTGEGGMITTNRDDLHGRLLELRSHGVHKDHGMEGTWEYEMRALGFNCRMTDLQAALGRSQLRKLERFKRRRREIVDFYNERLGFAHLGERPWSDACFHLYPILVRDRRAFYFRAREEGLRLQVHYIPVHTQPYYRSLGFRTGDFPKAEEYYAHCISLPLHPGLSDADLGEIAQRLDRVARDLKEGRYA